VDEAQVLGGRGWARVDEGAENKDHIKLHWTISRLALTKDYSMVPLVDAVEGKFS